jgi:hypothetical protein
MENGPANVKYPQLRQALRGASEPFGVLRSHRSPSGGPLAICLQGELGPGNTVLTWIAGPAAGPASHPEKKRAS